MKQELISSFQLTLISDKDSIQKGTEALALLRKKTGFCLGLIEIADDTTISAYIRQASLAQLKLATERRWFQTEKWRSHGLVPEEEKVQVRQYLFPAMIRCDKDIRFLRLYKAIIKNITMYDYEVWLPIDQIVNSLLNDPTNVVPTLHFLIGIIESFELLMDESRLYLSKIVVQAFPVLFNVIRTNSSTEVLFLTIKIVWKTFQMDLTQRMRQQSLKWIPALCEVLNFKDADIVNKNSDFSKYTAEFYYFHTKKWAARILYKFLHRHANVNFQRDNRSFEDSFYASFGPMVLETLLDQLKTPSVPKCLFFVMKGLDCYAQRRPLALQPHIKDLLYVRLPIFLKLMPEDDKLARSDPAEFFRKEEDPFQNFTNIKAAATNLWITLNQIGAPGNKTKSSPHFDNTLSMEPGKHMLESMEYLRNKLSSDNLLDREMAMYLVCKLRSTIIKIPMIKSIMPQLIASYIIPEFSNSEMLLRAKAVDMFTQYGDIDFPDKNTLKLAVEGIYKCLVSDPCKIVNIKAACAFSCILSHKQAIDMVKPLLNNILRIYITLLDVFDNEDIVRSLEGIINIFSDCIGQFAAELVRHLTSIFLKYCKIDHQKSKEGDYQGDVEMAASGCLNAITKIISSPVPLSVMSAIEEFIVPVISYCLTQQGNDHFLDSMDILCNYLYKAPVITQRMWFFFPTIIYYVIGLKPDVDISTILMFNESQSMIFKNLSKKRLEEVDSILPSLRVYIAKGKALIMAGEKDFFGQKLLLLLIELTDVIYQSIPSSEFEDVNNQKATATALLIYLLEVVDNNEQLVVLTVNVVKANLRDDDANKNLDIINVQLLSMCIYRAPVITMKALDNESLSAKAFTQMLSNQSRLEQSWQKRRFILALSNLMRHARQANVIQLITPIFKMAEKQIHDINMIRGEELQLNKKEQESIQSEKEDTDEDDQDEGLFWDQQHDNCYIDVLQDLDEVLYFEDSIRIIQTSETELYKQLTTILSTIEQQQLNSNIQKAKDIFLQQKQMRISTQLKVDVNQITNYI